MPLLRRLAPRLVSSAVLSCSNPAASAPNVAVAAAAAVSRVESQPHSVVDVTSDRNLCSPPAVDYNSLGGTCRARVLRH